jgi:hypothetical protein
MARLRLKDFLLPIHSLAEGFVFIYGQVGSHLEKKSSLSLLGFIAP